MPRRLFYLSLWTGLRSGEGVSSLALLLFYYYKKNPVLNANSVDPDQILVLRRLIWVYTVCSGPIYVTLKWVNEWAAETGILCT